MSKEAKRSAPIQIVYSHAGRKRGSRVVQGAATEVEVLFDAG